MADNSTGWRLPGAAVGVPPATWWAVPLVILLCTSIGLASDFGDDAGASASSNPVARAHPGVTAAVMPPSAPGRQSFVGEVKPWIHPEMSPAVTRKLEKAFALAVKRVRAEPACSELFHELGTNAEQTLRKALFFPANSRRETAACKRSVAQSYVGSPTTWICRRITSHSDEWVAAVLIHEALHHAGLPEDPVGRLARTSGSITKSVTTSCDLRRR